MNRGWFKPFAFAALALSLTAVSCDTLSDSPVSPEVQQSVQAPAISPVIVAPAALNLSSYHFITRTPPKQSLLDLSLLINILGGVLKLEKQSLTVPAGAVILPTLFNMHQATNGHVEVKLTALLQSLLGLLDIGGKGFLKPVTLSLSYANATNVTNASHLKIALLNSDGTIKEILPSVVNTSTKTVTAQLPHFSSYAMVSD
jgi:hypothetical protein